MLGTPSQSPGCCRRARAPELGEAARRDITEIRVFDHDEFVCKAVNQEHHDQKVSLKEIQAARNARRRALRASINERIALVAAPTETPRITEAPAPAPRSALKIYKEDLR
ncbi:hypothetical protein [Microbacterium sediminis]|uniref:hypothetical protein n=1 Tax=Microbacterium sediminis TaxID=904291 RepID=UPI000AC5F4F9|nr:hypothetical protein [Microbacterium sediminis]